MAKNETAAEHARRCMLAINHQPHDCPDDKPATTAALLGAYQRELKSEGIVDEGTTHILIIEAARHLLRDDGVLHVRKEVRNVGPFSEVAK